MQFNGIKDLCNKQVQKELEHKKKLVKNKKFAKIDELYEEIRKEVKRTNEEVYQRYIESQKKKYTTYKAGQ